MSVYDSNPETFLTFACDIKGGCSTSTPSVLTFGGSGSKIPLISYLPGPGIACNKII